MTDKHVNRFAVYDQMRKPDTTPVAELDDIIAAIRAATVLMQNGHQIVCVIDRHQGNKLVLGWDKP